MLNGPSFSAIPTPPVASQSPAPAVSDKPSVRFSFHGRKLPKNLTPLNSPAGRNIFKRSLVTSENMNIYFPLTSQFLTQSEPAYCGITSMAMGLNALGVDPTTFRWKGGWRWFTEDVFLEQFKALGDIEDIKREGITMDDFYRLGKNYGLELSMIRPDEVMSADSSNSGLDDFRSSIISSVVGGPVPPPDTSVSSENDCSCDNCTSSTPSDSFGSLSPDCTIETTPQATVMVVSFSRASLGQTGDGHFSPIGGYDSATDRALVLDVARFKYPPYWVGVSDLWEAMKPVDSATGMSRGYFLMKRKYIEGGEEREIINMDEEYIPEYGERRHCPMGKIKFK
ncbi:hypothetical protein TrST_g7482 [Triparma strigata]|uniref:glutathione gamma-glutamylcysteinyltransferase n=1 Tax=Triparma strigata TaxID=1606541 RepID=A0A9W7AC78_9STRA|nr:hypothetical protein TrST_g7482 [Triparma strigata]